MQFGSRISVLVLGVDVHEVKFCLVESSFLASASTPTLEPTQPLSGGYRGAHFSAGA